MFELSITGEASPRYVIIRGMTRQGGTGEPMHIDFFQVDPSRPIQANVPLHITGESPAVRDLAGTLLHSLEVVAVRCLPLAIPDSISIDASQLNDFEKSLTVGDLTAPGWRRDPHGPVRRHRHRRASTSPSRDAGEAGGEEPAAE